MKISKVYAVYFSPAGSTKDVAERIAAKIASALNVPFTGIDFTLPEGRKEKYRFASDELVVFGTPTYAGRIPNKALPFVQELFEADGTPAVSVVTYGNRNFDSSLTELVEEMGKNGFRVLAAVAWTCRHVFSKLLAPGRPDAEDHAKMDAFAEECAARVQSADAAVWAPPVVRGGEPVAPYYVPKGVDGLPAKFLKAKPLTDMDKCTKCGICAKVCPLGSISFEDFSEVPGICIKCQACVVKCPEGAKYFEDAAFLSHVKMLEQNFTRRSEPECYWSK